MMREFKTFSAQTPKIDFSVKQETSGVKLNNFQIEYWCKTLDVNRLNTIISPFVLTSLHQSNSHKNTGTHSNTKYQCTHVEPSCTFYIRCNEFNLLQSRSDDEGLKDESAEAKEGDERNPPESKTVSLSLHRCWSNCINY